MKVLILGGSKSGKSDFAQEIALKLAKGGVHYYVATMENTGTEADKATVLRARKIQRFMSQPFHVAESFTGQQGIYVPLEKTVDSVERILSGECDNIPEQYFLMSGTTDDVYSAYKKENG